MIRGMEKLLCEGRLKRLGSFALERRLKRGDVIKLFRLMNGIKKVAHSSRVSSGLSYGDPISVDGVRVWMLSGHVMQLKAI